MNFSPKMAMCLFAVALFGGAKKAEAFGVVKKDVGLAVEEDLNLGIETLSGSCPLPGGVYLKLEEAAKALALLPAGNSRDYAEEGVTFYIYYYHTDTAAAAHYNKHYYAAYEAANGYILAYEELAKILYEGPKALPAALPAAGKLAKEKKERLNLAIAARLEAATALGGLPAYEAYGAWAAAKGPAYKRAYLLAKRYIGAYTGLELILGTTRRLDEDANVVGTSVTKALGGTDTEK